MTGPDPVDIDGADVEGIERLLSEAGVTVLTVTHSSAEPGQVTVYLSGNAGRSRQEQALRMLRSLSGVESVTESPASWTILVLTLASEDPASS